MLRVRAQLLVVVALWMFGMAAPALAQSSSISGIVTDSSGAVLPGVTVVATSPALIEGSKTAMTDNNGRYAIVELRPGVFTVTFELSGFSTMKQEAVELPAGFTANVSAQMRVGNLTETIVVAAQAPVVDVQNVVRQNRISKDVIDAIPTGKSWSQLGVLTVGVSGILADVGGSAGEQQNNMTAHGGHILDKVIEMDGMRLGLLLGSTSATGISSNDASTQEMTIEIGGSSAESTGGGVRVNIIPKEGGNTFAGSVFGNFANKSMSNDNFTGVEKFQLSGVRAPDRVNKIYDSSFSLGGPIMKDRLWFLTAHREWGYENLRADAYFEKNPADYQYDPDLTHQAFDDQELGSHNLRLTWQANAKNRFSVYYDHQPRCTCHWTVGATRTPEASGLQRVPKNWYGTVSYNSTLGSKLFLTAGFANLSSTYTVLPQEDGIPIDPATGELSTLGYGILDSALGVSYRAVGFVPFSYNFTGTRNWRASLNYVTGSHQMKYGATLIHGPKEINNWMTSKDTSLVFNNRAPFAIRRAATPYVEKEHLDADLGLFAQDSWRLRRVTVNAGLRFDLMKQSVPAQTAPAGTWVGARSWGKVSNVPNWKDLNLRLGGVYDLFGTGKTALKASVNRYVRQNATAFATANNPINTNINSSTQRWVDNGDFIPQANELIGPQTPGPVGSPVAATVYDAAVREGWHVRRNNWETLVGLQQELRPRVGAEITYIRRKQANFTSTDNLLVTPADYQQFCVTAPVDSRLPLSGQQICGLYDVVPTKAGLVQNVVTFDDASRARHESWEGVDLNLNARLGEKAFAQGGLSTGRTKYQGCRSTDNPGRFTYSGPVSDETSRFCAWDTPFLTQYKAIAGYFFPWDIQASLAFQSLPGREISANWAATDPFISPSLGRSLAGSTSYTVELVEPGTMYGERLNQVDLRFSKLVRFAGARRLRLMADVYNAMNANTVISQNSTYNATQSANNWQRPTQILVGRFFKVGAQFDF